MKRGLILAAVLMLAAPAHAAPAQDTLTDAALVDYARNFFPPTGYSLPTDNKDGLATVGRYHGVEVKASGVPCNGCIAPYVAIYLDIDDMRACRKLGGRAVVYRYRGESRVAKFTPLCVPEVLVRNRLYGDGELKVRPR